MPKQIRRKIGEIHEIDIVKTPWDKVKEFFDGLAKVCAVVLVLIFILATIG